MLSNPKLNNIVSVKPCKAFLQMFFYLIVEGIGTKAN